MKVFIDYSVNDDCYNPYESYGEICIGCGCCSKDPKERAEARLELYQRQLDRVENFNNWFDDPKIRAIQEKNIKIDTKIYKKRIRYYKKRLKEIKEQNDS